MTWLQKLASVELYYHGTAGDNLPTILSQGLTLHHPKAWDTDPEMDRSRASYGGIYLSRNFMTAFGAGGNANRAKKRHYGDSRVLVVAQIENRTPSVLLDEDRLPAPGQAFAAASRSNAGEAYYLWFVTNEHSAELEAVSDEYTKSLGYLFSADRRLLDHLRKYVPELMEAYALREAIIAIKYDHFRRVQNPGVPEMSVEEADNNYRRVADAFMHKARRLSGLYTNDYTNNIRFMEPLGYSGRNKIVLVCLFEKQDEGPYHDIVTIKYGNHMPAIHSLISAIKEMLGSHFVIKDDRGNVYYDKRREDQHAASA